MERRHALVAGTLVLSETVSRLGWCRYSAGLHSQVSIPLVSKRHQHFIRTAGNWTWPSRKSHCR